MINTLKSAETYQGLWGKNLVAFLISIQFFGFFFDDNFFYLATAVLYLKYYLLRNEITKTNINRYLLYAFFGTIAILLAANSMRIVDLSVADFNGRDWRIIVTPIVCLMAVDAVYSLARYYDVQLKDVALWFVLAIIGGTFAFVVWSPEVELSRMLQFGEVRRTGLVDRNPNMADDVYFFLICSMLAFGLFIASRISLRAVLFALCAVLGVYFALLILQGQSRGGWLGMVFGTFFFVVYAALLKRYVAMIVIVAVAIPILLFKGDMLTERLSFEGKLRADIWQQLQTTGSVDLDKLNDADGPSTLRRLKSYSNGWTLLKRAPLTGNGTFNPETMKEFVSYPMILVEIHHLHNFFLDIAVRQGIGVMAVYLMLILSPIYILIRLSYRYRSDFRIFYFLGVFLAFAIYLFIENLTNLTFIRRDPGVRIQYILMGIYGLILAETTRRNELAERD